MFSFNFDSIFLKKQILFGKLEYQKQSSRGVLRNFSKFTGKHLCQSLFFNEACNFVKKEVLAQVFSCEFSEISKNNFSYRTPLVAASGVQIEYDLILNWP